VGRNPLSWSIQYVHIVLSIIARCSQIFPASYDYGAAISESRELTDKYAELKRQGIFLRSSPEFYKTDWIGNSSTGAVTTNNPAAFVTLLRNPDSKASFYLARQKDSTSMLVSTPSFVDKPLPNSNPQVNNQSEDKRLGVYDVFPDSSGRLFPRYQWTAIESHSHGLRVWHFEALVFDGSDLFRRQDW